MTETTAYVVACTRSHPGKAKAGEERHAFTEWDSAVAFFEEIAADRHTDAARLLEVTEREVRSVEHEPHKE